MVRSKPLQRDSAVLGERDAVPQQLNAARQQQAIDLVVVGDQHTRTDFSHYIGPSILQRHVRIPPPAPPSRPSRGLDQHPIL